MVKEISRFTTSKYWYSLHHFPGDHKFVITRLPISATQVVRAEELGVFDDESSARVRFELLKGSEG